MPSARQTKSAGLVVSAFVGLSAALLAYRQHGERRMREEDLSVADAEHFRSQDRRRAVGSVLMLILAIGLAVGSSLPHMAGGRSNPEFLIVWLAVFVLIVVLLGLAFVDLLATRVYARRQRKALIQERLDVAREAARQRASGGGHRNGASPSGNGFPH